MGIPENRLSYENIANLNTSNFDTDPNVDVTSYVNMDTTIKGLSNGNKDIFKPQVKINVPNSSTALQSFNDSNTDCSDKNGYSDPYFKLGKNNKANSRGLDSSRNTHCDKLSPMDNFLGNNKLLNTNMSVLTSNMQGKAEDVIKDTANGQVSGFAKTYMDTDNLTSMVMQSVHGATGNLGTTLTSKLNMGDAFGGCSNVVNGLTSLNPNSFTFGKTLSAMLKRLACLGMGEVTSFTNTVIGTSQSDLSGVVNGVLGSISGSGDTLLEGKLGILKDTLESGSNTLLGNTANSHNLLLDSIGNLTESTKDSVTQYTSIFTSLDAIDPSWKEDDNGNESYYNTKSNKKMKSLSDSYLMNRLSTNDDLSGNVTTHIEPADNIAIINSF